MIAMIAELTCQALATLVEFPDDRTGLRHRRSFLSAKTRPLWSASLRLLHYGWLSHEGTEAYFGRCTGLLLTVRQTTLRHSQPLLCVLNLNSHWSTDVAYNDQGDKIMENSEHEHLLYKMRPGTSSPGP
jgi:hypothetical protein